MAEPEKVTFTSEEMTASLPSFSACVIGPAVSVIAARIKREIAAIKRAIPAGKGREQAIAIVLSAHKK